MAMLASKASYPAPLGNGTQSNMYNSNTSAHRPQAPGSSSTTGGTYSSPTESEFSDKWDPTDTVRSWDEKQVGDWLRSIRCGQYEPLFRANNFNGDNLLECDQKVLQELGIKKVGDRVRIFLAIKQLRNKSSSARRKRNRDSLLALEGQVQTPSSTDSPRPLNIRSQTGSVNRRWSRQVDLSALHGMNMSMIGLQKPSSRPSSPRAESDNRGLRAQRYAASPSEILRKDPVTGYFSHPSSASTSSGRRPETPVITTQTARSISHHVRASPSIDGLTMGSLPPNSPVIRIIYTGGQTKVINVKNCRSPDEVAATVLKKLQLPETHYKNYCFYVLDGLDPQPSHCRRVSDSELMKISEGNRPERNRLILRRINDGEPDIEEVRRAAKFAMDESAAVHNTALSANSMRNQLKLQKLTGEPWHNIAQQPMSPASVMDRNRNIMSTAEDLERPDVQNLKPGQPGGSKLRAFFGARPPSEMIVQDMTSYFPSNTREDIEKTMRLSVRRSQRMSRAASRISVMSNASWASSMKDAPPIPSIADAWLGPNPTRASRPLSVSKFALPQMTFRDSIVSSLQPLAEESPIEPNRKSYVSFDSGSDSANHTLDSQDAHKSYFDETASVADTNTGSSLQERLSMLVAEDGEEEDPGLSSFLTGNQFDKFNWIKGSLIGEGSFGAVSLALHAVTGELMAVKQVELPSVEQGTEIDKRKNGMIVALKHEIDLLQGMQHPNIVQYLGTSQDDKFLNIFLEYVPGGSIAEMLKQYNTFPEPLVRNFVRQILEGLNYLHDKGIIHRDIKGANVLVDNKGGIKISDFGISKRVEASSMLGATPGGLNRPSLQGSVFWMAPEVVRQSAHTKKADIWSLGCLIVEMFSGSHPFPDKTQLQAIFAIGSTQAKPHIPESCSEDARKFLDKTFEIDHEKRPSAEELLKEKFLVPIT